MADQLYFSRDTKVFIEIGSSIWEVPVLDGFSFSQATNASEVTLSEMSGTGGSSRRGRRMFTDSFAPAEWSFSTYMRPFTTVGAADTGSGETAQTAVQNQLTSKLAGITDGDHHAVEEVLWAMLAGPGYYDSATDEFKSAASGTAYISHSTTSADIDFAQSNKSTLGTADIFFAMGGDNDTKTVYKIADCVVNEASADFDIDGIATINWSGMGSIISDEGTTVPTATITEGITATNNFIRNRLTTLTAIRDGEFNTAATIGTGAANQPVEGRRYKITTLGSTPTNWTSIGAAASPAVGEIFTANAQPATGDGTAQQENQYGLVLTGGNITITNNMTFLTPETLGSVNQPIGHVTGARSVSGSFTCYLNNDTDSSAELFEDLIGATTTVTNNHTLKFDIGGLSPNLPRVQMSMASCHLELPSHAIDDVISLETAFHALPSAIDLTDEITVKYFGRDVT
jgi:hypothetical protein